MKELIVLIKEFFMNRVSLQGDIVLVDDKLLNLSDINKVRLSTSDKHIDDLINTLVNNKYVIDSHTEVGGYSIFNLVNISKLNLMNIQVTTDNLPRPSSLDVINEKINNVALTPLVRKQLKEIIRNMHTSSVSIIHREKILGLLKGVQSKIKVGDNEDSDIHHEKTKEKTIYTMGLHESIVVNGGISVMRVPGGWIYDDWCVESDTPKRGIFIKYNAEFKYIDK